MMGMLLTGLDLDPMMHSLTARNILLADGGAPILFSLEMRERNRSSQNMPGYGEFIPREIRSSCKHGWLTGRFQGSKFHSGDKVYFLSEDGRFRTGGPYYIGDMGSNSSLTMYTLISEDGGKVLDGAEVKEERLEEYKG